MQVRRSIIFCIVIGTLLLLLLIILFILTLILVRIFGA